MSVAHLGHGSHVESVVQLAVPPDREPEDFLSARGNFDRGNAVVRGEVALSAKRRTSLVRPTVMAAITGPTPKILVVVVPDAATTAAVVPLFELGQLGLWVA